MDRGRANARSIRGRPGDRGCGRVRLSHVGAGRSFDPGGGDHGRRCAADASPARCADVVDERAAGGLSRTRRLGRVPLGVRGNDLRTLRLRARIAHGWDLARKGPRALRRPVRATRHCASRRSRGGGAHVPAAARAGHRAAPGDVRALEGVVGDAEALRRSGAAAGRPKEPRAARARRQPGRATRSTPSSGTGLPASARVP